VVLELSERDRAVVAGADGEAAAFAMKIVSRVAEAIGASRLIDVSSAHIDACHFAGTAGVDLAERLATGGGTVAIPTTLNVTSIDILHPDLYRGDPETAAATRRLIAAYTAMGCRPTWTCAPYQLEDRPSLGDQIAWGESNAIVFANSVLGARTERYGDFLDICAALVGRVPDAGLHRSEHRHAWSVFRTEGLDRRLLASEVLYPVLGHFIGQRTGVFIPAITGLPSDVTEDRLKSLGAAAASSGGVAMFHAVGITPEAPDLETATGGTRPRLDVTVSIDDLRRARDELTTDTDAALGAVSIGTPHSSLDELRRLALLVSDTELRMPFYVNTGRAVLAAAAADQVLQPLRDAGVEIVTDTCVYMTTIADGRGGALMTNSAKAAYYAPGNLGVEVVFGSLEDCVASAAAGRVVRDDSVWR